MTTTRPAVVRARILPGGPIRAIPAAALAPRRPDLTDREVQVLRGMALGQSNGRIGRELFLSEDTIKTHARRLFARLGATNRAHAVALGFHWRYLTPQTRPGAPW